MPGGADLDDRVVGKPAAVLPQRGPDRAAGRRGPGLRPCPRRHPPRCQALQPPARHLGRRLDHRLRPGQVGRERTDGHRRPARHLAIHGAGAAPRRGGRPRRRLRPGPDPLRAGDAPPGLRRGRPPAAPRPDQESGAGPAPRPRPADLAQPGDPPAQVDREGPEAPLPGRRRDGRGPAAVPRRRTNPRAAGRRARARLEVGDAPQGDRRADCSSRSSR